jgi:hypothetical protein
MVGASEGFWELMSLSAPIRTEYCMRHGYELLFKKYKKNLPLPQECERQYSILEALKGCDWLFETGADTLITNLTVKLEDIIAKYASDGHMIIGMDVNGINNDVVLYKNCPQVIELMNYIIKNFQHNDQYMMSKAFECHHAGIKEIRIPQKVFNAYLYDRFYHYGKRPEGQWEKGDFIIHIPALLFIERVAVIKEKLQEVIR